MVAAAPRLDPRLLDELDALARSAANAAEIRRALVLQARKLDVPPPSYEHVRRLVTLVRLEIAEEDEQASEVLPVALRAAVGLEHGNEILRVARGERRRRR